MTYAANNAAKYRELDVMSATPERLVVIVYDHLLVQLQRARIAIETNNVPLRLQQLPKCRAALTELLVTLDHDKGGRIAAQLSGLYTFLLSELVDLGLRPDIERLDRIVTLVSQLRDAFDSASRAPALAGVQ